VFFHLWAVVELEDRSFFRLAATIIPIVLFGSVLANAFRPPGLEVPIKAWHGIAAIGIAVYITLMASAEMLAIAVAVGGGGNDSIKAMVALALVVEIFGFGVAILVPWAVRFVKEKKAHWVAGTLVGISLVVAFGVASVSLMGYAFEGLNGTNSFRAIQRASDIADRTYLEWSRAAIEAHVDRHISQLERHELTVLRRRKEEAHQGQQFLGVSVPPVRYAR